MYYNVLKSIKYRKKLSLIIKQKWFLNILLKNHFLNFSKYQYNLLVNYISISKIRNRCIINGKSRSTSRKFKLSRFFLKSFAQNGQLNGIKKH